ncbi:MAG: hypothetical protein HY899_13395 [Deltaproteobacteria bacterium]|nr:hypothetical protein [Deltaproteobacteria bacterium]
MIDNSTMTQPEFGFVETLPVVGLLLGGVPTLTILVMTAAQYVATGTL